MKTFYFFILLFFYYQGHAQTTINVNAGTVIKTFDHNPNGMNVNYLMDDDTYLNPATSLKDALNNMKSGALRFPGGEKSDNYLWSVSPYTSPNPHFATQGNCNWPNNDTKFSSDFITLKKTTLDFDEFMAVCIANGARPLIVVAGDAHYNTWCANPPTLNSLITNAVEWVKYANITKKYNIKYWMIGNESWNSAAYDKPSTALQYANDFKQFSQAMKAVDSTIKVVANSQEGTWASTLLANVTDDKLIDAIAISNYPIYNWLSGYDTYRNGNPSFVSKVNSVVSAIGNRKIKVIVSEYNAIDWANAWTKDNDLGHAIVNFQMLGDQIKIPQLEDAYFWNTRWTDNATKPQNIYDALDKEGNLNASGKALAMWGNNFSDRFVFSENSGFIRSYAMTDSAGKILTIFLINKDVTNINVTINITNFPAISSPGLTIKESKFTGTSVTDKFPVISFPSGTATVSGNAVNIATQALSIHVIKLIAPSNTPAIKLSSASQAFGNILVNTTSAEKTYTLTGSNLTGNVTITSPAGFEISKTSQTGFASTLTVTPAAGNVNQTIYVRFKPVSAQPYNATISHSSPGATLQNITVTGTGTAIPTYKLTVTGGTGGGNFASGTKVSIAAGKASAGKIFDAWTGAVQYLKNTTDSINEITMPSQNITVTAGYKDIPLARDDLWNEILVYPNPTDGKINIVNLQNVRSVAILSMEGQILKNQSVQSIEALDLNIGDLPHGVYMIRIFLLNGDEKNYKVIKK